MTEFEMLIYSILVVLYGALCYICGKGDLLNIIPLMLQDMTMKLENRIKEGELLDAEILRGGNDE